MSCIAILASENLAASEWIKIETMQLLLPILGEMELRNLDLIVCSFVNELYRLRKYIRMAMKKS